MGSRRRRAARLRLVTEAGKVAVRMAAQDEGDVAGGKAAAYLEKPAA